MLSNVGQNRQCFCIVRNKITWIWFIDDKYYDLFHVNQEKMVVYNTSPGSLERLPASIFPPKTPKSDLEVRKKELGWKSESHLTIWIVSATHLSNQCYTMCIRREAGFCAICYVPTRDGINGNQNNQQSFGLRYFFLQMILSKGKNSHLSWLAAFQHFPRGWRCKIFSGVKMFNWLFDCEHDNKLNIHGVTINLTKIC